MSLTIGLVGVGPWGKHILRDLRTLGASVHAVSRSPDSIARAQDGGAASIVAAPQDLPDCDGYVVANRTTAHLDAIEALLPRGAPIFCEKPLSSDVARARRLPAEAHQRLFIMHKWRYHPGVIELARIAQSGEHGPVEGLRSLRLGWGNPHADANSLWVLGPHELSIALTVLGDVPVLVSAAPDAVDPGAGAVAVMRSAAGAPFVTEFSSGHPLPLRRIVLRCRDATCVLDQSDYAAVAVHRHAERAPQIVRVSDDMPLLAELRAFLAHIGGGPAPLSSLADELRIIETLAEIEAAIAAR